jgi:hypothetical protein
MLVPLDYKGDKFAVIMVEDKVNVVAATVL